MKIEFFGGPRDGDRIELEYAYPEYKVPLGPRAISLSVPIDDPSRINVPLLIHLYRLHNCKEHGPRYVYIGEQEA